MSPSAWPKAVPLLVVATLLVYANSINKTLVFDDDAWITDQPTLDDPQAYLKAMPGRPLLAVSIIAMHNCGKNNPIPHHVLNLFIHLAATLTLYGVVRRALLRPRFGDRFAGRAEHLAFAVALLWMAHPLQTQSVTYVIQRGESMAGLFYLLVLYCMLRADDVSPETGFRGGRLAWYGAAVLSLALGYTSKEMMASIPGAVLLFDVIFLSRSLRTMVRRRWIFYLVFFAVWGAFTYWHMTRAVEAKYGIGFNIETVSKQTYALTQAGVILYYLRICFWPRGLAIDYQGWGWTETIGQAMPELAIVAGLLLVTAALLYFRPTVGFVAAFFFIYLAPTSSILPIVDPVFEHRLYLSVASTVVFAVFAADWLLRAVRLPNARPIVLAAAALALGTLTFLRNEEYENRATVWTVAVERMPESVRAHSNQGQGLIIENRHAEAAKTLEAALEGSPYDPVSLLNYAAAHEGLGDYHVSLESYRRLKDAYPEDASHQKLFANTALLMRRLDEADAAYSKSIELDGGSAEAHYGRAATLIALGRHDEAEREARLAWRFDEVWPQRVLALARSLVLDGKMRGRPEVRRSALGWARLGMAHVQAPTPEHWDTLCLCLAADGRFHEAAAESHVALLHSPDGLWGSVLRDRLNHYDRGEAPWPATPAR